MVAARGGETRNSDARTGGGVSGRFRLLGGSGEVPDPAPPVFGTAPWGYRRSEVDAWASWVAGIVAHGRNETVRADSAEATLRATLARLAQLEHPRAGTTDAEPVPPLSTPPTVADAGQVDAAPDGERDAPDPATATGTGTGATGRVRLGPPADLPRRPARDTGVAPASDAPAAAEGAAPDHDLARIRVVETTLHEVMDLLRHLAGPRGRATGGDTTAPSP